MEIFKLLGTVAISTDQANNELDDVTDKAKDASKNMSESFKKIGKAIATYFAVDKIISFGRECINAASDVQEMQNKFDVVFQGMTDDIEAWASTFAEAIGRNSNTIKGYLADNQNMFVGMGMTREASASLSENLVSLALDLASFNNLNEDDAVHAMSKALMGETESAKSLGAVLNENTLKLAQNALGYQGKFEDLTEAQKMEVRYQAILMQSADAVGDCARSLDSYKGKTIQLNSAKEKLRETIGQMLLPVMTKLTGMITNVVSGLQVAVEWISQNRTAATLIAVALGTVATAITAYNIAQNAATIATTIATTATAAWGSVMAFATSPVTLVVLAIGALIAIIVLCVQHWDEISEKVTEVVGIIKEKITAFVDGAKEKFEAFKEAAKEKFEALKGVVKEKFEAVKETMSNVLGAAKSAVQEKLNNIKNAFNENGGGLKGAVSAAWESIKGYFTLGFTFIDNLTGGKLTALKDAFVEKLGAARDKVKEIIEKIKGFFNFTWELPKLKMPHFTISGKFSIDPPSVPKFSIDWYKKAMDAPMIMNQPTVFGMNKSGQLMAGGEAGSEVVSGTGTLMNMIQNAVREESASAMQNLSNSISAIYAILNRYIPEMASRQLILDTGAVVGELAPAMDAELGNLYKLKKRGV